MARRGGGKKKSGGKSLGAYLRQMPAGFVQLLLATGIMGVGGAVSSLLSGNLVLNFNIGTNAVTLDLGFIPGMVVTFGGLFMFISGLRKVMKTKL